MKKELKKVMTEQVITVNWNDTVDFAYGLMKKNNFRHLPVVGDGKIIVGVVSEKDLDLAIWLSTQESENTFSEIVAEYMSWPVVYVPTEMSLNEVTKIMREKKISSVLVADDERLVGIVTTDDILRFFTEQEIEETANVEKVRAWFYKTQIGQLASALANVGI
ncbi:MAG: CBS domain-containing protein [Bdellovibrionales bacterium]